MEDRIRALVARIDTELSRTQEVSWIGPATPASIALVESTLGVRFPASFRIFLSLTGGGGVRGLSISSVESDDPLAESDGTVYGDTLYYRESWVPKPLPSHLIVVERDADDNEPFCLDTSKWVQDECPVVLYYPHLGTVDKIAPNFLSFYERYLEPRFQDADSDEEDTD